MRDKASTITATNGRQPSVIAPPSLDELLAQLDELLAQRRASPFQLSGGQHGRDQT